ncbi:MAG: HNH endonuclease [Hydrogenophaga sp.]|uniref:HNH endonuclease n=1 Tax=Hydrogenophaga sp. TaxID=1904254 RepID=UPI0025C64D23|nr:hypothetical protein [Hydrogenophaga sp.]MBU7572104.1 HNH endonuclease [Hydrogenophaga sp.]
MPFQLLSDDGSLLDARFDLDADNIVFHSRGGSKAKNGTNLDYSRALTLLIRRLAAVGWPVDRAWLDSAQVQAMPLEERVILHTSECNMPAPQMVSLMSRRMQGMARKPTSKSKNGNSTKRIRLLIRAGSKSSELIRWLKAVPVAADLRTQQRLPASELSKVTAEHLWNAVERFRTGFTDHGFDESTNYDLLLHDGSRLPPKAVFGIALSEALGFKATPKHFSAGVDTPCFLSLEAAGYLIVPKNSSEVGVGDQSQPKSSDPEWLEGTPKVRLHLQRERASGLREAKKAEFRRKHGGKLFCERCGKDPVDEYKSRHADACIEVHHRKTHVADMADGHKTSLQDLACLCANCHRLEHRLLRLEVQAEAASQTHPTTGKLSAR